MSDCRHRQGMKRHEFSRTDDGSIAEVFGCEKHGGCTLVDHGVTMLDLTAPPRSRRMRSPGRQDSRGRGNLLLWWPDHRLCLLNIR